MKLIIYGIIIGIAKVIPGISGSLLAISFGIYEKTIHIITHFFDDFKNNLIYLFKLGIGIIIGIVLLSKIVLFFITNYYFYSMILFTGLIISSIIKQYKCITIKPLIIISTVIVLLLITKNSYIKLNANSNITYLICGFIEVISSLIPGISGTSLLLSFGIYNDILKLITNVFNIKFIINNYLKYIFFTIGIISSFIGCSLLVDYLYKKHKILFDNSILGLSIESIIIIISLINYQISFLNLLLGLFLFSFGVILGIML